MEWSVGGKTLATRMTFDQCRARTSAQFVPAYAAHQLTTVRSTFSSASRSFQTFPAISI